MKTLHIISTAALAAFMFIAGCETDPNSSSGGPDMRPMTAGGGSDAHPAIAYHTQVTSHNKMYQAIAVMDSDGTDQAVVYTASNETYYMNSGPRWSPSGGTIAFPLHTSTSSTDMVLRDVSVSRGKAAGSNTRTLYSTSGDLSGLSWSSLASTAQIAFTTFASPAARVQVISISGGTPTVLYQNSSSVQHYYHSPTWSPDDEKIAFVDRTTSTGVDTVRVIDASDGTLLETIPIGTTQGLISGTDIEWSRSGLNQLALTIDYGSGPDLYYVTPTTGSTLSTNNVSGTFPTWSPSNGAVVTLLVGSGSNNTLQKTTTGTTTTSTIATGRIWEPNWKR